LLQKIDHVAIAVSSLESALKVYEEALGFSAWTVEEIPQQKVRVALLNIGESRIELLEATAADSPIAGFLAKRGEGLHHICFQVDDLAGELARLRTSGMRLIDDKFRIGAGGGMIAFLHPSCTAGVLIELVQQDAHIGPNSHSK
jgi:methylmalonyl-CoA/ethylmalonyl-CoA epimerase